MKQMDFELELSWFDPEGRLHYIIVDRFKLLPGDKVDSRLKFTFLGDKVEVDKN